jgi:hypothetical protein
MLFKTTKKLFRNIYQYKIVLVVDGAAMFRSGDMVKTVEDLKQVNLQQSQKNLTWKSSFIKTQDSLDYAFKLAGLLANMKDFDLRVESPWITLYSNSKKDILTLSKIDEDRVKYVSMPAPNTSIVEGTVIMPKMDFDYRITLGKTTQPNPAFIAWAGSSKKCKLTKSCIRDLEKVRSWGGTHFYISGDNNLLMAKMHLGGSIAKVERIVKN